MVAAQCLLLLLEVVPQIHQRKEIRLFVVKAAMFVIRRLLFVARALTRILNRQTRSNHHHFFQTAKTRRFQNHACQTRVDWQASQFAANVSQTFLRIVGIGIDGAQLFKQAHAILNVALIRRFHKRECFNVAQSQRSHLQDN